MRISTTTLESYRLYCEGDWMPEEELIANITGQFVPTHNVKLGSAFGKVLETPDRYRVPHGYTCDGFNFGDDVMEEPLALMDRRGVYEAKAERRYEAATVVAKADQIVGARLIEHKTTLSTFDFEKYAKSYQWRFMADIFVPAFVTYHVFCLAEAPNGVISLRGIESFNLFPYPDLHQDCCDLLRRFCDYVRTKGLESLLIERQKRSEAA